MSKWCGSAVTHGAHSYPFGKGTADCPGYTATS